MKRVILLVGVILCLQFFFPASAGAQAGAARVKELNFVFLHGAGGHTDSMQALDDAISKQAQDYINHYEQDKPGIKIQVNTLLRYYPNDVDIMSWANNLADTVDTYFTGKRNLIIVGHSMGGKTALYAVAHNTNGLADKTAMVVTINSPIRRLNQYFTPGGSSVDSLCRAGYLLSDHGVCESISDYDSSADGEMVANNKHWLAFISAESAPTSPQFDKNGVDGYPHDMDDGLVPI